MIESMSHILNGCHFYKGLYTARHDRIVNLIKKSVCSMSPSVVFHCDTQVKPNMFANNNPLAFVHISANTPDIIKIDEDRREVVLLEVGCTFD